MSKIKNSDWKITLKERFENENNSDSFTQAIC